MKFEYRQYAVAPIPGQPDTMIARPVIPVTVTGRTGSEVVMGLLDTGADITLLPAFVLPLIGSKYDADRSVEIAGVGGVPVTAHFAEVQFALRDRSRLIQWSAKVGFLEGPSVALLGTTGFLNYFSALFDGSRQQISLKTNKQFPGEVIQL